MKKFIIAALLFIASPALAQWQVPDHSIPIGRGAGTGFKSMLCTSAQLVVGQAAADPICKTITGDWTISAAGAATLATVNANVGSFGSATQCVSVTYNAKGLATAASATACTPAVGSITGFGTGVATALAINVGTTLGIARTIATGTSALGTSAISSATCATVVTTSATNTATTDVVTASFNSDPTAVTGYVPLTTGMLSILVYPTTNNVNFKVCNNTSSSITPGAITLNWRVAR